MHEPSGKFDRSPRSIYFSRAEKHSAASCDYDKYSARNNDESVLSQDAAFLKSHPEMKVVIGGYCDERGSDEYNVALGQNRADSAQKNC